MPAKPTLSVLPKSNLLRFPGVRSTSRLQVVEGTTATDPFRRLRPEERRSILDSFHVHGRSIRSIARLIDCAESKVEEVIREAKREGDARHAINIGLLRGAA